MNGKLYLCLFSLQLYCYINLKINFKSNLFSVVQLIKLFREEWLPYLEAERTQKTKKAESTESKSTVLIEESNTEKYGEIISKRNKILQPVVEKAKFSNSFSNFTNDAFEGINHRQNVLANALLLLSFSEWAPKCNSIVTPEYNSRHVFIKNFTRRAQYELSMFEEAMQGKTNSFQGSAITALGYQKALKNSSVPDRSFLRTIAKHNYHDTTLQTDYSNVLVQYGQYSANCLTTQCVKQLQVIFGIEELGCLHKGLDYVAFDLARMFQVFQTNDRVIDSDLLNKICEDMKFEGVLEGKTSFEQKLDTFCLFFQFSTDFRLAILEGQHRLLFLFLILRRLAIKPVVPSENHSRMYNIPAGSTLFGNFDIHLHFIKFAPRCSIPSTIPAELVRQLPIFSRQIQQQRRKEVKEGWQDSFTDLFQNVSSKVYEKIKGKKFDWFSYVTTNVRSDTFKEIENWLSRIHSQIAEQFTFHVMDDPVIQKDIQKLELKKEDLQKFLGSKKFKTYNLNIINYTIEKGNYSDHRRKLYGINLVPKIGNLALHVMPYLFMLLIFTEEGYSTLKSFVECYDWNHDETEFDMFNPDFLVHWVVGPVNKVSNYIVQHMKETGFIKTKTTEASTTTNRLLFAAKHFYTIQILNLLTEHGNSSGKYMSQFKEFITWRTNEESHLKTCFNFSCPLHGFLETFPDLIENGIKIAKDDYDESDERFDELNIIIANKDKKYSIKNFNLFKTENFKFENFTGISSVGALYSVEEFQNKNPKQHNKIEPTKIQDLIPFEAWNMYEIFKLINTNQLTFVTEHSSNLLRGKKGSPKKKSASQNNNSTKKTQITSNLATDKTSASNKTNRDNEDKNADKNKNDVNVTENTDNQDNANVTENADVTENDNTHDDAHDTEDDASNITGGSDDTNDLIDSVGGKNRKRKSSIAEGNPKKSAKHKQTVLSRNESADSVESTYENPLQELEKKMLEVVKKLQTLTPKNTYSWDILDKLISQPLQYADSEPFTSEDLITQKINTWVSKQEEFFEEAFQEASRRKGKEFLNKEVCDNLIVQTIRFFMEYVDMQATTNHDGLLSCYQMRFIMCTCIDFLQFNYDGEKDYETYFNPSLLLNLTRIAETCVDYDRVCESFKKLTCFDSDSDDEKPPAKPDSRYKNKVSKNKKQKTEKAQNIPNKGLQKGKFEEYTLEGPTESNRPLHLGNTKQYFHETPQEKDQATSKKATNSVGALQPQTFEDYYTKARYDAIIQALASAKTPITLNLVPTKTAKDQKGEHPTTHVSKAATENRSTRTAIADNKESGKPPEDTNNEHNKAEHTVHQSDIDKSKETAGKDKNSPNASKKPTTRDEKSNKNQKTSVTQDTSKSKEASGQDKISTGPYFSVKNLRSRTINSPEKPKKSKN